MFVSPMRRDQQAFSGFPSLGRIAVVALASFFLTGCGSGFQTVTGTVQFADGKPISSGEVLFQSMDDEKACFTAEIQEDGSFELRAPPGSYLARIERPDVDDDARAPAIHWKYANFDTSGLEFDVEPGSNEIEIRLAKGPAQRPETQDSDGGSDGDDN